MSPKILFQTWLKKTRERAAALKAQTHALYLACKDSRVPWHAKLIAAFVLGYALSPIDLIPDFIPILGYLDDLILVPLGITLAIRLIPREIFLEHLQTAQRIHFEPKKSRLAAGIIVTVWSLFLFWGIWALWRILKLSKQ